MKKLFYLFILVFTICFICEKRPALAADILPCRTVTFSPKTVGSNGGGMQRAVLKRSVVWTQRDTVTQETGTALILSVRFLDGTAEERNLVRQIAPEWSKHANVRFEFVEHDPSDIRIGFDPNDGHWSKLGEIANSYKNEKTMNLALHGSSEDGKRRVILHEFGHALGLHHEHQSPAFSIQWNEKAVIEDTKGWGWSEETTRFNILDRLDEEHTNFTEFDPHSIMVYPIPNRWTIGNFETDYNAALSATDKQFIGKVYDVPDPNDAINIPDANLRAAIESALGKASGATITTADMARLTQLNAQNANISNLTGLEGATNLEYLNLGGNNISDISALLGVTNLPRLYLWGNNISDISALSRLTNLRYLSLWGNNISDISALSRLTNLAGLWLKDNNISDLSLLVSNTGLGSGDTVDVKGNPLSSASFNTHIPTLQRRGVEVEFDLPVTIPDTNLRAKIEQALGKASGATITTADMETLTQLNTPNANISNLTGLEYATNLTWLNLQDNNISDISPLVSNTGLTAGNRGGFITVEDTVILWGNPLSDESINTHIPVLRQRGVDVRFNAPAPPQTVTIPDANLRAKIEQALGKTSGATITTADMARLTRLNIFNITISSLTGLEHATNLRNLTLNSINITDISALRGLTNLTELSLPANKIVNISAVSRLTNLRSLNLNSNSISDISPVGGLTNLTQLSIGGNNIMNISPVEGLTNLTQLALHSNNIVDISAISGLTNLTGIILWGNSISDLSPLVSNTGLGSGNSVDVLKNPLNAASLNTHIPTLQRRGVNVKFDTKSTSANPPTHTKGDVNRDGVVNIQDLVLTARRFGERGQNDADMNNDGVVNIQDLVLVARAFGNTAAAPALHPQALTPLTAAEVQNWLTEAEQMALTTPTYLRGIAVLEQLLAALTPKETILLPNYPNPFNPETWIPYHLSDTSDVAITIYDVRGRVVRRLALGYKQAGYYTDRSSAAYWDGRNELGEPVASGIYFYSLTTDNFTATRLMLILK